jgi:hypothetical protein
MEIPWCCFQTHLADQPCPTIAVICFFFPRHCTITQNLNQTGINTLPKSILYYKFSYFTGIHIQLLLTKNCYSNVKHTYHCKENVSTWIHMTY